jgi:hypothetical protein
MLKEPNLIQRLLRAPKTEFSAMAGRAFGGAMLGMNSDQWDMLQGVFHPDYMGAAEYEMGVFPAAIGRLVADRARYQLWSFTLQGKHTKPGYWREPAFQKARTEQIRAAKAVGEKPPKLTPKKKREMQAALGMAPVKDTVVYVVSDGRIPKQEVEDLILDVNHGKWFVKNGANFDLDPNPAYKQDRQREVVGWFDLRNTLVWFTDQETANKFAAVFLEQATESQRSPL